MTDVSSARVKVTGDVRDFARQTEADLNASLKRITLDPVQVPVDDEKAREAGKEAGRKAGEGVKEGTKDSLKKGGFSNFLKAAFTPKPGLFDALRAPFAAALSIPIVGAIVSVAAVAAAAFVAAFTASIATAGLGAAFLGIGAAALFGAKELDSSLARLGETLKNVGKSAAGPLMKPFISAINLLADRALRLTPILHGIFADLAPTIVPLVQGMAGFVEEFLKALTADPSTLEAMSDALIALGANLPRLGTALGKVFVLLASNENNVRNIGLLFGLLESAIVRLGIVLYGLSKALDGIIIAWNAIKDAGAATVEWVTGTAIPAITGAASAVGRFFATIPGVISTTWAAVTGFLSGILTRITGFISSLAVSVIGFFTALPDRVMSALAALPGILASFFSSLFSDIAYLVGFGIGSVVKFFMALPGQVKAAVSAIPGILANIFLTAWNAARAIVSSGLAAVIRFFAALPGRARSAISSLAAIVSSIFSSAAGSARSGANNLVTGAVNTIRTLPGRIRSALSGVRSAVASAFSGAGSWLYSAGRNIIAGVRNGIVSAISGAVAAARAAARRIVQSFRDALSIGSPSQVMEDDVGRWIPAGVASGIANNRKVLDDEVRDLASSLPGMVIPNGGARGGDGASISVTLQSGAIQISGQGGDAGQAAAEALLERLGQAVLVR